MDATTRRCMVVLSEEIDHIHAAVRQARTEQAEQTAEVRREVSDTRKTVIAMMSAIIVTVIATGIVNVLWR